MVAGNAPNYVGSVTIRINLHNLLVVELNRSSVTYTSSIHYIEIIGITDSTLAYRHTTSGRMYLFCRRKHIPRFRRI